MLYEHLLSPTLVFDKPDDKGADPPEGDDTDTDIMPEADADALRKEITKLRGEAAKYRTRSKDYDDTKSRLEKLENGLKGLFGEDEEVDPEKLKVKTQSLESELQKERLKRVVMQQAISEGLDPDLTIAYLDNKGKLAEADPNDSDAISILVSKAAKEKAALKVNGADKVGADDDDKASEPKEKLNPIDEYRRRRGILPATKK